jgi:hypothetical protein
VKITKFIQRSSIKLLKNLNRWVYYFIDARDNNLIEYILKKDFSKSKKFK